MQLECAKTEEAFTMAAGTYVLSVIKAQPHLTIALPTGNTPRGLYRFLSQKKNASTVFKDAFFFNLDEYVGLPRESPFSFSSFLLNNFLNPAGISSNQFRLLRGDVPDLAAEAMAYDADIAAREGIDLLILGLGANGHIAFNEPRTCWQSNTHTVELTPQTRAANADYFPAGTPVPTHGITMGLRTIQSAKRVLLLVSGSSKQEALKSLLLRKPDPVWPVTCLCEHPSLHVIADFQP